MELGVDPIMKWNDKFYHKKKTHWVELQEGCNLMEIIMCALKTWLLEVAHMKWVIAYNVSVMLLARQFKQTNQYDY